MHSLAVQTLVSRVLLITSLPVLAAPALRCSLTRFTSSALAHVASAQAFPLLPIWLALQTSPSLCQFQDPSQLSWINYLDILSLFCLLRKAQMGET